MFLKDETKCFCYLKWEEKQRQSDWRIEIMQNTLLFPFAAALLIPIIPTVWNCPTRTYFEVCLCPMDLLWLLGCSQNSEVRGIRAIWMKFFPTKAGTKASTSCHPRRITNADCRIYTAPTVYSQPSRCLRTEINVCSFILGNEWMFFFSGMLCFSSRSSSLHHTLVLLWTRIHKNAEI